MLISFFLGFAGGLVLGWLQSRILLGIVGSHGAKRYLLLLLKLALWGGSMTLLALWSIPVLLLFVLGATAGMLGMAIRTYRTQKGV